MVINFANWNIEVELYGDSAWVGVNYQDTVITNSEDVCPDFGVGERGKTIEEAAISCIHSIWKNNDGGLEKAVQLAAAMIAVGLIPTNCLLTDNAAIIDGVWYFGMCDPDHMENGGIHRWFELFEAHRISEFKFSLEGEKLAHQIYEHERAEAQVWAKAYDAWEGTWINGPQWQ